MSATLIPEHAHNTSHEVTGPELMIQYEDARKVQDELELELREAVNRVKTLESLMKRKNRGYCDPDNYESRVRSQSRRTKHRESVSMIQYTSEGSSFIPGDHQETVKLESVSSHGSLAIGKQPKPRKSVWGFLSSALAVSTDDPNGASELTSDICVSGSNDESLALPPQVPLKTPIVRLSEYLSSNPTKPTGCIHLVEPWIPDGGPRPGHLTPIVPGRDTEEAPSGGKRIIFANKLFKRNGFVDWNRFNHIDHNLNSSNMAFLFEVPYSGRSGCTSRFSARSSPRTARRI